MNIMAFSFDWFLTVPGMLISGGVLLLLIALIMFIVTSVKSKKETKGEESATLETPTVENTEPAPVPVTPDAVPQPTVEMTQPTEQPVVAPVVTPAPAEVPTINEATPVVPTMDAVQAVTPEPAVATPEVAPVQPVEQPMSQPVEQSVATSTPEAAGNTAEINQEDLETPEALNLEKTTVSIYGGANPLEGTQNLTPVSDAAKPIYGGANPAEIKPMETQAPAPATEMPASAAPSIPMDGPMPTTQPAPAQAAEPVKVETTETIEQL